LKLEKNRKKGQPNPNGPLAAHKPQHRALPASQPSPLSSFPPPLSLARGPHPHPSLSFHLPSPSHVSLGARRSTAPSPTASRRASTRLPRAARDRATPSRPCACPATVRSLGVMELQATVSSPSPIALSPLTPWKETDAINGIHGVKLTDAL
jgi:hypothetical protein